MGWWQTISSRAAASDYPRAKPEFDAWFKTEGDCLAYLVRSRWRAGFSCPDMECAGQTA